MDLNGKPLTAKRVILVIVGSSIVIGIIVFTGGITGWVDAMYVGAGIIIALQGWFARGLLGR